MTEMKKQTRFTKKLFNTTGQYNSKFGMFP